MGVETIAFNNDILEKLYPGTKSLLYPPMLIHAATDNHLKEACQSNLYFGELKKDGAFYQYIKSSDDKAYLFGRTISKKTKVFTEKSANVPHIMNALSNLPNRTVIIGEIYYPGKSSKDVVSIMGCLPEKAIERQKGNYGLIHYYVHDILVYDGVDLVSSHVNNYLRYKILNKIFSIHNLSSFDFLELAEIWEDNLYERIGDALSKGEEGMVLKRKDRLYEPGKRPNSNLKAKKVDFIDAIIIGFEEPTELYYGKELDSWTYWRNKETRERKYGLYSHNVSYEPITKPCYMGWTNSRIKIGAVKENGSLVQIGTIHSGISDEMKADMTNNPDKYLNKVCSIQCMEKDNDAFSIRHGFYKGLREDKSIDDCTMDSIF